MTHTPERLHVGYDQEYDIDAGDDGRTIGHPTGRDEFDGTIFTVTGEDQIEIIAEHIRDEKTALRIAALWNMAERLGLSTEEIESGNVETKLKTAPDMLEALEQTYATIENRLICPFCGCALDHRHDCIAILIQTAIRKARGERYCHSEYGSANCKWEPGIGCTPKCPECIPIGGGGMTHTPIMQWRWNNVF